jgi:hypothetical protein
MPFIANHKWFWKLSNTTSKYPKLIQEHVKEYILNWCQRFVMDKSVQIFLKDWNCKFLGSYVNSFYAFKANIEISMLFIETC